MRWTANRRQEPAACQEHFIDLCNLLGKPTPETDPPGAIYPFEKVTKEAGRDDGWADVWRHSCIAGKCKKLNVAHCQILQYAGVLVNPPPAERR